MSLEKLSPDCLMLVFEYITITEIQELAVTSNALRSLCLITRFEKPVAMPLSKVNYPEILLKIATTIQISETIVKTGTDWLACILRHFGNIRTVDVVTKGLSRQTIQAILKVCETSETVKTITVHNTEVMKWIKNIRQKHLSIKPHYLKNIRHSQVKIMSEKKVVLQGFNEYLTAVALKYNSGVKLNNPDEALALNNIMVIGQDNTFGVDAKNWAVYVEQSSIKITLPCLSEEKKKSINIIVSEYFINILKNKDTLLDIQSKYKGETSKETKLCLDILKNVDASKKARDSDSSKEEDTFITDYVDTMFFSPLFNYIDQDIKKHGNRHALKESKHRKIKQAKKNDDKTKGQRGRIPDRSFELFVSKNSSYNVFICEVKANKASKSHPDLSKLGSMLKDLLDYALEQGVTREYAVTGLLVGGAECTVYSMIMSCPKLYHMIPVRSFKLPKTTSELGATISSIIECIQICQTLINASCSKLKSVITRHKDVDDFITPTCSSPPNYTDYYK